MGAGGGTRWAEVEEIPRERAGRKRDTRQGITGPSTVRVVNVHTAHRPPREAADADAAASTGRREPSWSCRWPVRPYRRSTCLNPHGHAAGDCQHPMLVVQPGQPHEHGLDGWRADLLSYGLKPVDLNSPDPATVVEWQVRLERGRLTAITRSGAGSRYEQAGGHPTPGEWRQAARRTRSVLLLVVPAGTVDPTADPDGRASLARAGQAGNVLGGVVPVRGSLS